jgi:prepilin-type N-terminal cleavage/methylation domain-containing protein
MQPNRSSSTQGFTLVELAIVLMIIGLLIGGILRGQELVNNAKITSTVQQVKGYEAATVTFRDAYNALPGDIADVVVKARIPGCETGNSNGCLGGNAATGGNGIIGLPNSPMTMQSGSAAYPQVETTMFWKHLSLVHLISGITPNAPVTPATWGKSHPVAKLRGGFHVVYLDGTSGGSIAIGGSSGHFLRLQTPITGSSMYTGSCPGGGANCAPTEAVSPKEAYQIDKKMDNGMPDSGSVLADDQAGGASGCETKYDPRMETALCVMYFRLI